MAGLTPDCAGFIIGPAERRTRWFHPSYGSLCLGARARHNARPIWHYVGGKMAGDIISRECCNPSTQAGSILPGG